MFGAASRKQRVAWRQRNPSNTSGAIQLRHPFYRRKGRVRLQIGSSKKQQKIFQKTAILSNPKGNQ